MVLLKAVGIWFLLLVLAVTNGVLRNALLEPRLGELLAHQVSTLTGITLVFLVNLALVGWLGLDRPLHYWLIGILWVIMTIAFEFPFGHYVVGHPWSRLFHDYNVLEGRVWLLFLVAVACSPYLAAKLRAWYNRGKGIIF